MKTMQIGDRWLSEREGGLGRYYAELLRYLPAAGIDVHGLVVGSRSIEEESNGMLTAFARADDPLWKRLYSVRQTSLPMLKHGVDLIAAHFALYAVPLIDKMASTPMVMHFHGPWASESGIDGSNRWNAHAKTIIEAMVYRRARAFVVLSEAFRRELVERFGVMDAQIHTISGGVDTLRFNANETRTDARRRLGWPEDRRIVLAVRRQVRRMGLEALIDAARLLAKRQPDLLLLLGGTGPLAEELRQRIVEYGLEDKIKLLGRVADADLPTTYRAADLTVVPSQALEGFGLITVESLACGTPVLVTPVGGLPEIVRPLDPGCIFGDGSAAEMAQVLDEALAGRRSLPSEQACRQYAVDSFAWPRIAQRVGDIYREAAR